MRNSAAASVTITTRTSFKRLGAKGEILIHLVCSKDHSKYSIKQYLRAKVITNQRCVFKEVLSNQLLVVFDHFLLPCFTPPLFGLTLFGPKLTAFCPYKCFEQVRLQVCLRHAEYPWTGELQSCQFPKPLSDDTHCKH